MSLARLSCKHLADGAVRRLHQASEDLLQNARYQPRPSHKRRDDLRQYACDIYLPTSA